MSSNLFAKKPTPTPLAKQITGVTHIEHEHLSVYNRQVTLTSPTLMGTNIVPLHTVTSSFLFTAFWHTKLLSRASEAAVRDQLNAGLYVWQYSRLVAVSYSSGITYVVTLCSEATWCEAEKKKSVKMSLTLGQVYG